MPYYQSNTLKHALCSSSSPLRRSGGEVLERICSKLGGGLERTIVPVDSPVVAIEGPYATRAGELQDMVLRNMDCVNINSEYTTIDSHFSIIDDLKIVNNQENDLYFYHSDHLGSSSFITDADGIVSQHLQYLPYGELFAEQRDNTARYYTPYKFSGKEKDEETGYSYFGARYYMPELSIWSAVDVMSDKHPNVSAYAYCNNNPVILVDPDGNDWFLNEITGAVYFNFQMKPGQEGTGAMTGEGWKHMGGNGMFMNSEIDPQRNDISLAVSNGGDAHFDATKQRFEAELMLDGGGKAEKFMGDMGYSKVPKLYEFTNNVNDSYISDADGDNNIMTVDNGSQISKVYSWQYAKNNLFRNTKTLTYGQENRKEIVSRPLVINRTSTDLNIDYYSSWPTLQGTARDIFLTYTSSRIEDWSTKFFKKIKMKGF